MRVSFSTDGWDDYCSWSGDIRMLARINRLIEESLRDPAVGMGKPKRLGHDLTGYWSRRISAEHRLVYTIVGEDLVVVQARHHY